MPVNIEPAKLPDIDLEALLPPDAREFCVKNDLLDALRMSLKLVRECFPSLQKLSLELKHDPEEDWEYVVIDALVQAEVPVALDCYRQYIERIVSEIPWQQSMHICLMYYVG